MWLPWSAADGLLMCTSWEMARQPCLNVGQGMLPWEWHHFQQQHLVNATSDNATTPTAADVTVHALHAEQEPKAEAGAPGFNLVDHIVELKSTSQELQQLEDLTDRPVLLLNSLVHLDLTNATDFEEQSRQYHKMVEHCNLLNTTAMIMKYDLQSWNFNGPSLAMNTQHEPSDIAMMPSRLRKGNFHRHFHSATSQQNSQS